MKKVDWDYVKDSLKDIKESMGALNKWDGKDRSEYHYHNMIINISLENIKSEMGICK